MTVYINGRFLTQPVSGVQRYAREILGALDTELGASKQLRARLGKVEVLVPCKVDAPNWQHLNMRIVRGSGGHIWEQNALYQASRNGVLVSLGNSGPIRHSAHVLCLHDANLYEIPEAFSRRYRLAHRMLRPILAQRAAALLTVSAFSADALSRRLGVSVDRFSIVPNSAQHVLSWPKSTDALSRYGLEKGYFLAVGTQSANKNIAALIAAHAQIEGADLVLVGGGVPGVLGTEFANSGRVHALGRVPDTDLRALYEGASAFVFPSLYEGFGIPPLEAMQLGVPVLCARSGAMPAVLGAAPMWFNPRDIWSIADALSVFGSADHAAMVNAGLRCAANYTWCDSALGLVDVILRVDQGIALAA